MNKNKRCEIKCKICNKKVVRSGNATKMCRTCSSKKKYYTKVNLNKLRKTCIQCDSKFAPKTHNQITCGEICRVNYYKEKFGRWYISPKIKVMLQKIEKTTQKD